MSIEAELRQRQVAQYASSQSSAGNKDLLSGIEFANVAKNGRDDENSGTRSQTQERRVSKAWSAKTIFFGLVIFRVINALSIKTFFQPDEFYQSLEPAWQLAFGNESGAWLTWEWHHHLRSSLHPILFACVYRIVATVSEWLSSSQGLRDEVLLIAPKLLQAVIAASIDFYTWRLALRLEEPGSMTAKWTLIGMVMSPWQWFCSTRTFSNSLEAALTALALYFWPWNWLAPKTNVRQKLGHGISSIREDLVRLRLAYFLAALSVVLRPTGAILWLVMGAMTFLKVSNTHRLALVSGAVGSGIIALGLSVLSDRVYFGTWTLPAVKFLQINAVEKIADFYGVSRLDYYFTEGLPLLLCFASLPFAIWGVGRGIMNLARPPQRGSLSASTTVYTTLAVTSLTVVLAFTAISHKEVRFLYPLLPILTILAAKEFQHISQRHSTRLPFKIGLALTAVLHIALAWYVTQVHQRGVMDVMHKLRAMHADNPTMTVGFLMPCHSTPWRSHLIHPDIQAWALTCEPPLGIPISERATYRDEADQFYDDPLGWVKANMRDIRMDHFNLRSRYWPDVLVFFGQLQVTVGEILKSEGREYRPCQAELFNTHWHDDWRRQGNVIMYCKSRGLDMAI